MAKGLQLTGTSITELTVYDISFDDANVRVRHTIDEASGYPIREQFEEELFSEMPTQEKAALNNFLRMRSKRINNDVVEENSSTWTDI